MPNYNEERELHLKIITKNAEFITVSQNAENLMLQQQEDSEKLLRASFS